MKTKNKDNILLLQRIGLNSRSLKIPLYNYMSSIKKENIKRMNEKAFVFLFSLFDRKMVCNEKRRF